VARSIRIEYAGAFYHVMARGNSREPIFLDKEDGKQFVKALGEVCAMTGWRLDSLLSSIAQPKQQSEKENVSRFAH
jgi:hypothetical protein